MRISKSADDFVKVDVFVFEEFSGSVLLDFVIVERMRRRVFQQPKCKGGLMFISRSIYEFILDFVIRLISYIFFIESEADMIRIEYMVGEEVLILGWLNKTIDPMSMNKKYLLSFARHYADLSSTAGLAQVLAHHRSTIESRFLVKENVSPSHFIRFCINSREGERHIKFPVCFPSPGEVGKSIKICKGTSWLPVEAVFWQDLFSHNFLLQAIPFPDEPPVLPIREEESFSRTVKDGIWALAILFLILLGIFIVTAPEYIFGIVIVLFCLWADGCVG